MKVLTISPHPDDECLGCGGTLTDHWLKGDIIDIIYLTSGEANDPQHLREGEAAEVCGALNARPHFWREPDGALEDAPRLVEKLQDFLEKQRIDVVYAPHSHDGHRDHLAAARIAWRAVTACEQDRCPILRTYEIWTPLREVTHLVNIEPYRAKKLALIYTYQSQFGGAMFLNHMADAITGLNRYRAVVNAHQEYGLAEAFG